MIAQVVMTSFDIAHGLPLGTLLFRRIANVRNETKACSELPDIEVNCAPAGSPSLSNPSPLQPCKVT